MSAIRSVLMTMARQQADAVSSGKWSDDEVRRALGVAHDKEWSKILAAHPNVRSAVRTVTSDSNSQITFASLDGSSGDTREAFYRVLAFHDGTYQYSPVDYQDVPLGTLLGTEAGATLERCYYPFGDGLQVLPLNAGASFTLAVNHKPQNAYQLTDDTKSVVFPENQDLLLAIVAAQFLLAKGGEETAASAALEPAAREIRDLMLDDLSHRYAGPIVMRFSDRAYQWGG